MSVYSLFCVCVCVCILPVVIFVQLKYLTGGVWWLSSIEHIQAGLKSSYSGVMLLNTHKRTSNQSTIEPTITTFTILTVTVLLTISPLTASWISVAFLTLRQPSWKDSSLFHPAAYLKDIAILIFLVHSKYRLVMLYIFLPVNKSQQKAFISL